ncbi:MAG: hypothetical protein ACLFUS_04985 [Candidatus Sumerlaeia bacterium]
MRIRHYLIVLILFAALSLGGCELYRQDRAWIPPEKYKIARQEYDRTGSLMLVEQKLHQLHWQDAEVNEAIYRLKKEYRLE